jgi:hypothetical protein
VEAAAEKAMTATPSRTSCLTLRAEVVTGVLVMVSTPKLLECGCACAPVVGAPGSWGQVPVRSSLREVPFWHRGRCARPGAVANGRETSSNDSGC